MAIPNQAHVPTPHAMEATAPASHVAAAKLCVGLTEFAILRIFVEYRIFDLIPDTGDIAISDLAAKVNGQTSLIERFANLLIGRGTLAPGSAPGRVAHNEISRGYKFGQVPSLLITHIFNFLAVGAPAWPEFFQKHGLQEPQQSNVTPYGLAMGYPERDLFGILKEVPKTERLYNLFMSRINNLVSLKDIYDFSWMKEVIEKEPQRTLIVDIGGGKGAGLKNIFADAEYIPTERCVIFDRPDVVKENREIIDPELKKVQLQEGSMFEKQPIKGALIYQICRVLNDWPDSDVLTVLKQTRAACAPDSRVLIVEEMLVPKPPNLMLMQDVFLMNLGGKRRNEKIYGELGAQAGLKVKSSNITDNCGIVELVPVYE